MADPTVIVRPTRVVSGLRIIIVRIIVSSRHVDIEACSAAAISRMAVRLIVFCSIVNKKEHSHGLSFYRAVVKPNTS